MSQDKKTIPATERLPIVNSVFRSDFEFPGIKTLFRVSHSNGDYLISLAAVLDVLYHVLEADLQTQWNIIPPTGVVEILRLQPGKILLLGLLPRRALSSRNKLSIPGQQLFPH